MTQLPHLHYVTHNHYISHMLLKHGGACLHFSSLSTVGTRGGSGEHSSLDKILPIKVVPTMCNHMQSICERSSFNASQLSSQSGFTLKAPKDHLIVQLAV